jgi:hypothetical protein
VVVNTITGYTKPYSCQGTPIFAQLGDIQIRALFLP